MIRFASSLIVLVATACNSLDTVAVDNDDVSPDTPQTGRVVVADSRTWGNDTYVVNSAAIEGDSLKIGVSYAGGCQPHAFTLVIAPSFAESDPVQLTAELAHEANNDACEAWLTVDYVFDLVLVRTRYREAYGSGAAKVVLQIAGVTAAGLVYEFTS